MPTPQPQLVQHLATSSNWPGESALGDDYEKWLAEPVGAGNCIILWVTHAMEHSATISDNNANTWPATPAATAGGQEGTSFISECFVLPNANAGMTKFKVHFGALTNPCQITISEYNNIATVSPVSGSSGNANGHVGPTLAAGSFTPTNNDANGGNLIIGYSCNYYDANGNPTLWTPNVGVLLDADIAWTSGQGIPHASMAYVQTTAAAINPTFSITGDTGTLYNMGAVALKVASAGTAIPAGIRIKKTIFQTNNPPASWNLQVPATGNLRVLVTCNNYLGTAVTDVLDSDGHHWTMIEGTAEEPMFWYCANQSANPNLTITIASTGGSIATFVFFDIQGAATSPYDVSAGMPGTVLDNLTIINDAPVITPTTANGLVIAACGLGDGPGLGFNTGAPAGAVFDMIHYSNENDGDSYNNADLIGHLHNTDTSTLHWNWSITSTPDNTGFATAVAFKAAPTQTYVWDIPAGSLAITAGACSWVWSGAPPGNPTWVSTASGTTDVTSLVVNIGSPTVGTRAVVMLNKRGVAAFTTVPSGWTVVDALRSNGSTNSTCCYYRDCDGTEGATITFVVASAISFSAACAKIPAGTFDTATAPALAQHQVTTAASNNNPNAVTPAWGSANDLILQWIGCNGNVTVTGSPSGYSTVASVISTTSTAANRQRCGWCYRTVVTSSEDAGAWTNASSISTAYSIAIKPYAAPAIATSGAIVEVTPGTTTEAAAAGQTQTATCAAVVSGNCAELPVLAQHQTAAAVQTSSAGGLTELAGLSALAGSALVETSSGALLQLAGIAQSGLASVVSVVVGSVVEVAGASVTASGSVGQSGTAALLDALGVSQSQRATVVESTSGSLVELLGLNASSTSFVISVGEAGTGSCVQLMGLTERAVAAAVTVATGHNSEVATLAENSSADAYAEDQGSCTEATLGGELAHGSVTSQGAGALFETLLASAFAGVYVADIGESVTGSCLQLASALQVATGDIQQNPAAFVIERLVGRFGPIVYEIVGSGRVRVSDTNTGTVDWDNMLISIGDRKVVHVTALPAAAAQVHFFLVGPEGDTSQDLDFELGKDADVVQVDSTATAFDFTTPPLVLPGVYSIAYLTEYGPSKASDLVRFSVQDVPSNKEREDLQT